MFFYKKKSSDLADRVATTVLAFGWVTVLEGVIV